MIMNYTFDEYIDMILIYGACNKNSSEVWNNIHCNIQHVGIQVQKQSAARTRTFKAVYRLW